MMRMVEQFNICMADVSGLPPLIGASFQSIELLLQAASHTGTAFASANHAPTALTFYWPKPVT